MSSDNRDRETIECPDIVPEEQKGMTAEELEWIAKDPPKPRVPRYVFVAAALLLAAAFGGGGYWYYRTNVLPEKYNQRAEALMKEKNFAEAEELYEKIIKIRPERKDVLFNMAVCCEENGDAESAIKYCEEHLKSAKNDARAMARLAWLYMKSGNYEKALHRFREAAKHDKKNEELWRMTAEAAKKTGDVKTAAEALLQRAKLCAGDVDKVLACGKELLTLGNYKDAADVFADAAAKSAPDDNRALHGIKAARAMLGLPTEEKYIIRPGRSLGLIRIGAAKSEVREAMNWAPVDEKIFAKIGGSSIMSQQPVEIWVYGKGDRSRELRIIFTDDKVCEIETASPMYKTDDGLGLSNFLLPKSAGKIKWKRAAENGVLVSAVKGGGLTFFASGLKNDDAEAEQSRLRVHKGETSIDNLNGFPLLHFDD